MSRLRDLPTKDKSLLILDVVEPTRDKSPAYANWAVRDMVTDPLVTADLLARMARVAGVNPRLSYTDLGWSCEISRPAATTINYPTPGEAVADAFMLANGFIEQ